MWLLYNIGFGIVYLLMLPKFLLRMRKRGGYRRGFMQRFARYDRATRERLAERPRVWIHAVSVGEMFVALHVMAALRAGDAGQAFVVTTTTSTGHRIASGQLDARDVLLYVPADFPPIVRRALRLVNPSALVLTEVEIWPNLIRFAKARGVPVALINGRISDRSYRGYRRLRPLMARVLGMIDPLLAQTEGDAGKFKALGARPETVRVVGTAKFDMALEKASGSAAPADAMRALGVGPDTPVIVGGSTWAGEEALLLDAFVGLKREHAALKLILIPRHMERAGEVVRDIEVRGLAYLRRSNGEAAGEGEASILLVDTTGEAMGFYAAASMIFVGKSLLHHGGQNFIEAAALGKPVFTGPHLENFADVERAFHERDALIQVGDGAALETALRELLNDAAKRADRGRRAREAVESGAGAAARTVELLAPMVTGKGSVDSDGHGQYAG